MAVQCNFGEIADRIERALGILQNEPESIDALGALARAKYDRALECERLEMDVEDASYREIADLFSQVAEKKPEAATYLTLSEVLENLEDYKGMKTNLEIAVELESENREARYRLGSLLRDEFDDYLGAEEQFKTAIETAGQENCPKERIALAGLYFEHPSLFMGEDEPAYYANIEKLLDLNEQDHTCYSRKIQGEIYLHDNKVEDAEMALTQAVKLCPENVEVLFNLGIALMLQQKDQEALTPFLAGRMLSPNHPGINANLAVLYANHGYSELAIPHAQIALEYGADMPPLVEEMNKILGDLKPQQE